MGTCGLKGSAVGVASLLLVLLGAHLAWERHRYRLWTPQGVVRIGMTRETMRAVLGPTPFASGQFGVIHLERWEGSEGAVIVSYDLEGRVAHAAFQPPDRPASRIPRPSLFEVVRSWLVGKRGE